VICNHVLRVKRRALRGRSRGSHRGGEILTRVRIGFSVGADEIERVRRVNESGARL
jgi:hypothetical protein